MQTGYAKTLVPQLSHPAIYIPSEDVTSLRAVFAITDSLKASILEGKDDVPGHNVLKWKQWTPDIINIGTYSVSRMNKQSSGQTLNWKQKMGDVFTKKKTLIWSCNINLLSRSNSRSTSSLTYQGQQEMSYWEQLSHLVNLDISSGHLQINPEPRPELYLTWLKHLAAEK